MEILRLGRLDYAAGLALMEARLRARIAGEVDDALLLCEHDPVFTLGRRRGAEGNVLAPGGAPVVEVSRGGDVTFHGPGQLVGYPILGLEGPRRDLHAYLRGLEALIIGLLQGYGLDAGRDPRNTGVWVAGRKVAAIGISCRRWVTWHGFAINVTTDLSWFEQINPCGMPSALTTRLADLLDPCPSLEAVQEDTAAAFAAWWRDWRAGP